MAKGGWVIAQIEDTKLTYSYERHHFDKRKGINPWLICKYCGLMRLNNRPTRKAVKLGCNWRLKL